MRRYLVLAALLVGCPRPTPSVDTREARALRVAGLIYGVDFTGARVSYAPVVCRAYGEWDGYLTPKGNCVRGAVAPWQPVVVVAGKPGMRLADSGFCMGAWELYEISRGLAPNQDSPGEADFVAKCQAGLRAENL